MSASKDKINRRQQIEAGTDKRTIAAEKAAKERRKSTIQYVVIGVILVLFFAFIFLYNSSLPSRYTTAVTIDGQDYSVAEVNYYYSSSYMSFYNNYNSYIQYGMFFDPSQSLADQEYSEGVSWRQYFLDAAVDSMTEIQLLNNAADEAGFVLPEAEQAEYEEAVESIRTNWADYGYSSLKQYINMNYGKGVTMELIEEQLYRTYRASAYSQSVYDGYSYTNDELAAYYADHADDMDMFTYSYYYVTDETMDAQAVAAAVNGTSEEEFAAYLAENFEDAAPSTLTYAGSDLSDVYGDWLRDASRAPGDAAAITDEDGEATYVVMFLGRDSGDYATVDFRHILINAEDADGDGEYSEEEIAAAFDEAESLYEEWQNGAATEDSFAELANAYSEDGGSNTTGGLYENVYHGQMVEVINDWLFEDGRQPGDTTVVTNDGSYTGTHVVYFVGTSDMTFAQYQADTAMRSEAYSSWMEEAEAAAEVTTRHMGMCGKNH